MEQAFPSIPQEVKDRLHAKGFKPWREEPLHAMINPNSTAYWITNSVIFLLCWKGRSLAIQHGSPRFFWSAAIVSMPLVALMTKARLDHPDDIVGHRKTLDERLDFSPITRRAWERALQINQSYQTELRQEIEDLEKKLGKHH